MPTKRTLPTDMDHDTLVSLKTSFDIFIKQYSLDMAELKDGYTAKMSDHEIRIKALEKIIEITQPVQSFNEFKLLQQQVRDFVVSANIFRVLTGIIGGLLVFILTQLPSVLRSFNIIE